ncbi:MAG: transposase, partial [Anaerolineales bacterium]|nr:transposase [Anaerolineales bacterium]
MAIIPRRSLFCWKNVESSSDLDRLRLVLESLPDEALMVKLEAHRGKGRDDYPVRAIWNSLLAGIVFQHESVESLRRELSRNGELRDLCGFDPLGGGQTVPSSDAYSRFLKRLIREQEAIEEMFDSLIGEL